MATTAIDQTAVLPSDTTISELRTLIVKDKEGKPVTFDALVQGPRTATVLIRHFDCGVNHMRLEMCIA